MAIGATTLVEVERDSKVVASRRRRSAVSFMKIQSNIKYQYSLLLLLIGAC